jgi:ribosomal protein S12 methylthiotransferase
LVERLRNASKDLTFRTAFVVGHPGETQADFDELCDFVRWGDFDRVAVFRYSDEPGTLAHAMTDKVSPLVAANRCRRLEAIGRRIAQRKSLELIDQTVAVLVEGPSDEHEAVLMGRHPGQAPEIDGQIYLSTAEAPDLEVEPGDLIAVRITQASDVDFVGVPLGDRDGAGYLG